MMKTQIIRELIQKLRSENKDDNVTGISYSNKIINGKFTNHLSVTFYVQRKINKDEINPQFLIPDKIEYSGYEFLTDVSTIGVDYSSAECPDSFYDWQTNPIPFEKVSKLSGGTNILFCTLGGLVIDNTTNSLAGLTNAHCGWWKNINSDVNPFFPLNYGTTQIYYNGTNNDVQIVGIQKRYSPGFRPPTTTKVDAALLTVPYDLIDFTTSYRQVGLTGWTQPMDFATTEEIDNLIFTKGNLYSTGITTGAKGEGEMKLVCVATNFYHEFRGIPQVEDMVVYVASATTTPNGTACPYPIYYGDSGSIVSADINGVRKIIGLGSLMVTYRTPSGDPLYGAGVVRIDNIVESLDISPWTGQTDISFSSTANTETYYTESNYNNKTIQLSGKTFWQWGQIVTTPTPSVTVTPTLSYNSTPYPTVTPTITQTVTRTPDPNCSPFTNVICYTYQIDFLPLGISNSFYPTLSIWVTYKDCFDPNIIKLVEVPLNIPKFICSSEVPIVVNSKENTATDGCPDIEDFTSITKLEVCGSHCPPPNPTPSATPTNYLLYSNLLPAQGSTTFELACSRLTSETAILWGYSTKPLSQMGLADVIYDIDTNLPKQTFGLRFRAFSATLDVSTQKYVIYWQNSGSSITSVEPCI